MILFEPSEKEIAQSQMAQFQAWLREKGVGPFEDYAAFHEWSIVHLEDFWKLFLEWSDLTLHIPAMETLEKRIMPGAKWFPGTQLNFAENLLQFALRGNLEKEAITAISESRPTLHFTYGELLDHVVRFATFLRKEGIRKGDRVGAIVSNSPEAIIGMLATTALGAIWSSCSPDFGAQGILDRFGQIEPKLLIAVDGYSYNGKKFDCVERIQKVLDAIPSIKKCVVVSQIGSKLGAIEGKFEKWGEVLSQTKPKPMVFESLPFDHPVYILYSSGTTGVPKCIVHGAGGTLLQHQKELRLHTDLTSEDTFIYFTTCGWMMWNWMVSGLKTGCKIILFDGSPSYPTLERLWKIVEEEKVTIFGTSAKFLGSLRIAGLNIQETCKLKSLKAILSTGSPLLPEDFDWVYEKVKKDIRLSSISGGTDIVSCFVLGNPMLPVIRGEIQCKGLGMAVYAWDENQKSVVDQKGELVCTEPAPSMPIGFWKDPDGKKYREAYFEVYPGVWRHGDFIQFTKKGGSMIFGRSDATLNPGGVRIGTAEIYRQVETIEEVQDSLAVGKPTQGDEEIILYVVLKPGFSITPDLQKKIKERIRAQATPRHVPAQIIQIQEIPYTLSGKKVELAVAKILRGEEVKNREALANPKALDQFSKA